MIVMGDDMSTIYCGCDLEALGGPHLCAFHARMATVCGVDEVVDSVNTVTAHNQVQTWGIKGFAEDEEADVNDYKGSYAVGHDSPAPLSPDRRYEFHPVVTVEIPTGTMTTGGHFAVADLPYVGIGGAPTRATTLPTEGAARKQFPVASGVLDYFPDALVAVANVSWAGNEQHNPGQPLHWARGKSTDESDTLIRHFLQRGTLDVDGQRHSAKMVWRALAILQKEIEGEQK